MWLVIRTLVWEILNSSRSTAAYMRRFVKPSQVSIMTCRLFGTKQLSESMLTHCQLDTRGYISVKFEYNWNKFSLKKTLYVVCKLVVIFSRPLSVNLMMTRHQMETCSSLLVICVGNSPGSGEFPAQSPVTRSFDVSFDRCLNKRLRKHSWGWWFETLSRPLWRHCNVNWTSDYFQCIVGSRDMRAFATNFWFTFPFNSSQPRQNGRHFADDIFKRFFLGWKCMNFAYNFTVIFPKIQIYNILSLVQIMAWCRPNDKPLFLASYV